MKYNVFAIISAFVTLLMSCTSEIKFETDIIKSNEQQVVTFSAFSASYPDSKTVLDTDGSVLWMPNDEICIFNYKTKAKFISQNTDIASSADFTGFITRDSLTIWAFYPYSEDVSFSKDLITFILPSHQTAKEGSFGPKLFPSIAKTTNNELHFKNVCGGIKFTVENSDIKMVQITSIDKKSPLAGIATTTFDETETPIITDVQEPSYSVTVVPPDGEYFKPGVNYYIVLLPGALSSGFTFDYYTDKQTVAQYKKTSAVSVIRSSFSRLLSLDSSLSFDDISYTNLTTSTPANCYIVSKPGNYKFRADVMGNTSTSVGIPASAEVLWETFGTDVMPSGVDMVRLPVYKDGFIHFSTPPYLKNGNAVVAVKNSNGTILWSWHIWVCDGFDPIATAQDYPDGSGIFMDRNLGATTMDRDDPRIQGLLYQWGRKDPFTGSSSFTEAIQAKSAIDPLTATISRTTHNTLITEPTRYVCPGTMSSSNYYPIYTDSSIQWNEYWKSDSKGIDDPCPSGWRVPSGPVLVSASATAQKTGYELYSDSIAGGIWYPKTIQCGCWNRNLSTPFRSCYWMSETPYYYASSYYKYYYYYFESIVCSSYSNSMAALPIRCQRIVEKGNGDNEGTGENDW